MIEKYAEKTSGCPFEMALDAALCRCRDFVITTMFLIRMCICVDFFRLRKRKYGAFGG